MVNFFCEIKKVPSIYILCLRRIIYPRCHSMDDLDNIQPVLSQPGQFASVNLPYDEIRAALVHDPS